MMTPAIIKTIRSELSAALPRWGMSSHTTLAFLSCIVKVSEYFLK